MTILVCSFVNEIFFFSFPKYMEAIFKADNEKGLLYFLAILAYPNISTSDSGCKRKKSHVTIYEVCQALKK